MCVCVCVCVCVCAGFTHRLLWWVLLMSFWPGELGDCVVWEGNQQWFRHAVLVQNQENDFSVWEGGRLPGLLEGSSILLDNSGLLWVDDGGGIHDDSSTFTWCQLRKENTRKQKSQSYSKATTNYHSCKIYAFFHLTDLRNLTGKHWLNINICMQGWNDKW